MLRLGDSLVCGFVSDGLPAFEDLIHRLHRQACAFSQFLLRRDALFLL